uniref:NIF system FeS cluster assembly NifU N-terminal domain-containing protein n=1 Tax=Oncorhynchus tshawytscha TaxID=74940 RepID=A0A8C8GVB7_ONCTS
PIPYHAVGFVSQSAIFKKTRQSLQSCRDGQHEGLVVDHYENPINVGSLDKNAKNVGTGLVGAPACGDVMKLQIQVDEKGKIVDASVTTFGCGSAIASSSLVTEWVKCKSVRLGFRFIHLYVSTCRLTKLLRSRTLILPKNSAFHQSSFIALVSQTNRYYNRDMV